MRATHKTAKTTKGWRKAAPHIPSERRALLARCGRRAFLDPDNLAFPVMPKKGSCVVDCEGVRSALSRARQFGHKAIAAEAEAMGGRAGCRWAR